MCISVQTAYDNRQVSYKKNIGIKVNCTACALLLFQCSPFVTYPLNLIRAFETEHKQLVHYLKMHRGGAGLIAAIKSFALSDNYKNILQEMPLQNSQKKDFFCKNDTLHYTTIHLFSTIKRPLSILLLIECYFIL